MDMRFFEYSHLPKGLQTVSAIMHGTAWTIRALVDDSPEKEAGMRKLLEAKDCFVRASLPPEPVENKFPMRCTRNELGLPCDCGQCTHIRNVERNAR